MPFARHRLALAAAQLVDAAVTYSTLPAKDAERRVGIWDELVCGQEGRPGWLGRPLGPAVRLAKAAPERVGCADARSLAARVVGAVKAEATPQGVRVSPSDPSAKELTFAVRDVPAEGRDLTLFATLSAEPRRGYPADMPRIAEVAVSGGAEDLLAREPAMVGQTLRRQAERPLDGETGAYVSFQQAVRIGETVLPAYAVHPPFKACKGCVHWCRDVEVPAQTELRFSLGMSAKAPERSDGVWFSVWVAELDSGAPKGAFVRVFEASTKAHVWQPHAVSLAPWAGRRVRLKFVADCGPADNATTDQGYWGGVRLARADVPESEVTATESHMTWVGERPFEASFSCRSVRSRRVDLTFRIEGGEPVTLRSLSVHAAPDAQARLFEHGLVLANPSQEPYAFDVARLAPGRAFRRIRGTAGQDQQANSGGPVGASVELGPLEGLFLVERAGE